MFLNKSSTIEKRGGFKKSRDFYDRRTCYSRKRNIVNVINT